MAKFSKNKPVKKKIIEKIIEKVAEKEEPPKPKILFSTTDNNLASRLQNKFNITDVSVDKTDPVNPIKTYKFDATVEEVEKYLKEVK